jgi:hypothetical protein
MEVEYNPITGEITSSGEIIAHIQQINVKNWQASIDGTENNFPDVILALEWVFIQIELRDIKKQMKTDRVYAPKLPVGFYHGICQGLA